MKKPGGRPGGRPPGRRKAVELGLCFSCRARKVVLSRDKSWGFCLACKIGFRLGAQGEQIYDARAREIVSREFGI